MSKEPLAHLHTHTVLTVESGEVIMEIVDDDTDSVVVGFYLRPDQADELSSALIQMASLARRDIRHD